MQAVVEKVESKFSNLLIVVDQNKGTLYRSQYRQPTVASSEELECADKVLESSISQAIDEIYEEFRDQIDPLKQTTFTSMKSKKTGTALEDGNQSARVS